MTQFKKFAWYGSAVLASLAVAMVMLVSSSPRIASAAINGMSCNVASDASIALGGTATCTIDADEGTGNVQVLATNGTFTVTVTSGSLSGVAAGVVVGNGTGSVTFTDAPSVLAAGTVDTNGDGVITAADACTNCLIGAAFSGGFASVLATGFIDDDNDGVAGPAVADVIIAGDQWDVLAGGVADPDENAAAGPATAIAANLDTITVPYAANATTAGTVTITATQAGTTKTSNIVVRGNAATLTLNLLRARSTSAASCVGLGANAMAAFSGTQGILSAIVCATVKDAAGANIPTTPVVCTTTNGTFNTAVVNTNANGLVGDVAGTGSHELSPNVNSVAGSTATVTCSSGGISASKSIAFGGSNATCAISADPANPQVGTGSTVTATFKDSTGGSVSDGQAVTFTAVNAGSGTNAALAGASTTTNTGVSRQLLISAIPGPVAVTANIGTISCTTTVNFTGTVAQPNPPTTPPVATAGFTGTIAPAGLSIVSFTGSFAQLDAAGTAARIVSVSATVNGVMYTYVIGAPAFVNAAFVAQFPTGLNATLVIVKT